MDATRKPHIRWSGTSDLTNGLHANGSAHLADLARLIPGIETLVAPAPMADLVNRILTDLSPAMTALAIAAMGPAADKHVDEEALKLMRRLGANGHVLRALVAATGKAGQSERTVYLADRPPSPAVPGETGEQALERIFEEMDRVFRTTVTLHSPAVHWRCAVDLDWEHATFGIAPYVRWDGVVLEMDGTTVPETTSALLPGRKLSDLYDHPLLDEDLVIETTETHRGSLLVTTTRRPRITTWRDAATSKEES